MWLEAVLAVPDGIAVPDDVAGIAADGTRGRRLGRCGRGHPVPAGRLDDARPPHALAGGRHVNRRTRTMWAAVVAVAALDGRLLRR